MQAGIIVEAHLTWETSGVWPFPPKAVSRKGQHTRNSKKEACFLPMPEGRGLRTIEIV
ncbi:hypothetical protein KDW_33130 [Dictyobacter vulcani]|uniref:Uncharacterized protein n=1 Tax=Dictyobacter vulcani TaxID=2607529 RepID=A0A5J4KRR7_9CHLR|nr:hypothetical protein KDW_33130 [Dictyobacter vulcani]